MVILVQYIYTENHYLVYLKLIYVTYLSVKKRDEDKVELSDFFHIFSCINSKNKKTFVTKNQLRELPGTYLYDMVLKTPNIYK